MSSHVTGSGAYVISHVTGSGAYVSSHVNSSQWRSKISGALGGRGHVHHKMNFDPGFETA